jgi:hypothetical protein
MYCQKVVLFIFIINIIYLLPAGQYFFSVGMSKIIVGFSSAHRARTMYLPLCKPPSFTPSGPSRYIIVTAALSQETNFFANNPFAL